MRQAAPLIVIGALVAGLATTARAQTDKASAPAAPVKATVPARPGGVTPPPDYVIGTDDTLEIVFWREKDMSAGVVVRPDGKISLPLLNDLQAAGLTPDQLRESVQTEAVRFLEDPSVTVIVKQINSRKVFITGQVANPGPYPLSGPTTVLQLVAIAGGLTEFADQERIIVWRNNPLGQQISYLFNYKAVSHRRNLEQNITLRPGDTVVVP